MVKQLGVTRERVQKFLSQRRKVNWAKAALLQWLCNWSFSSNPGKVGENFLPRKRLLSAAMVPCPLVTTSCRNNHVINPRIHNNAFSCLYHANFHTRRSVNDLSLPRVIGPMLGNGKDVERRGWPKRERVRPATLCGAASTYARC